MSDIVTSYSVSSSSSSLATAVLDRSPSRSTAIDMSCDVQAQNHYWHVAASRKRGTDHRAGPRRHSQTIRNQPSHLCRLLRSNHVLERRSFCWTLHGRPKSGRVHGSVMEQNRRFVFAAGGTHCVPAAPSLATSSRSLSGSNERLVHNKHPRDVVCGVSFFQICQVGFVARDIFRALLLEATRGREMSGFSAVSQPRRWS